MLSERWALESSQEQYRNAPIHRMLPGDAWLRAVWALPPASQCAVGKRSVHDAYTSSRRARKRTQWFLITVTICD